MQYCTNFYNENDSYGANDTIVIIRYVKPLQAFACQLHPLGQLLKGLVDAFRATYGGVVANPRLLPYAVQEVSLAKL